MKFKKPTFPLFFRKLNKKNGGLSTASGGGDDDIPAGSGRWSFESSTTGLRWKRKPTVYTWFIDGFVFKVVYVLEAVVLVFTLGFFYLCCGCSI